MTHRLLRPLPIGLLLTALLASPVLAKDRRHHKGHGSHSRHHYNHRHSGHRHSSHRYSSSRHYYHHRPSVSFGFYSGPSYAPYYPYYAPAPAVVYREPAVVYREPVYVGTAVGASTEYQVQRALAKRGYYGGPIDGAVGGQTRAAIRAYQVDKGLPVSGQIDGNLLRSLRLL